MSPGQDYDDFNDDKTIIARIPVRDDNIPRKSILFFIEGMPEQMFPVHPGRGVTVGRKKGMDIRIDHPTVSREHLVLVRRGDTVEIEVKGRNGISLGGKQYENQVVGCRPPVAIEVGTVKCRLMVYTDAAKAPPPEPIQAPPPRPTPPPSPAPQRDTARGPSLELEERFDRVYTPDFEKAPPDPVELRRPVREPQFPRSREEHTDFAPRIVGGRTRGPASKRREIPKMGILALGGLLLLIALTAGLFMMWDGDAEQPPAPIAERRETLPETTETKLPEKPLPETPETADAGGAHAYHRTLIEQAKLLIEEGEPDSARDYLIDIPASSPHYAEARDLMTRLARP